MLELTPNEVHLIQTLRHDGVLKDVDTERFNPSRLVMVVCGDGHRLPKIMKYHGQLAEQRAIAPDEECLHAFAFNGGALLLACQSPLVNPNTHVDTFLREQIERTISMKGLARDGRPTVVFSSHAPCGAVRTVNMSVLQQITTLALAKSRHKAIEIGNYVDDQQRWRIPLFLHVHFPADASQPARDRTYCFSSRIFFEWLERQDKTRCQRDGYVKNCQDAV